LQPVLAPVALVLVARRLAVRSLAVRSLAVRNLVVQSLAVRSLVVRSPPLTLQRPMLAAVVPKSDLGWPSASSLLTVIESNT
jgi:hypothetical protein